MIYFYCRDCQVERPAHICDSCLGNCASFSTRADLYDAHPELRFRDLVAEAAATAAARVSRE